MKIKGSFLITAAWIFVAQLSVNAVSIGSVDDFEDGTTQGWTVGAAGIALHPFPPANIPTGGPAGIDDNYLRLTATGLAGAGSRLAALNMGTQWAGDYLSAGVQFISMDVRNLGTTDLSLRLAFEDSLAGLANNIAYSAAAVSLPAGSGWTSITFPLSAPSLIAPVGDVNSALTDTRVLRLYHSPLENFPNPVSPIPAVAAFLDVDNIRTVGSSNVPSVPDGSSTGLLFACAAGVLWLLRSR